MAPLKVMAPIPLPRIITEVRSDVSDGFVDWIEFRYSTSTGRNPINGADSCGHSFQSCMISFQLLGNKSRYRIVHSHDMKVLILLQILVDLLDV